MKLVFFFTFVADFAEGNNLLVVNYLRHFSARGGEIEVCELTNCLAITLLCRPYNHQPEISNFELYLK